MDYNKAIKKLSIYLNERVKEIALKCKVPIEEVWEELNERLPEEINK